MNVNYIENETDAANLELLKSIVVGRETCFGKTIRAKKYKFLRDWIEQKTPFLDDERIELKTRIYWIIHNVQEFKKCQHCDNDLPHHFNAQNVKTGYSQKACSKECQYELAQIHSKETCLDKYGVEFSFQSDNNKQKSKITCNKKFGCDFAIQNKDVATKMVETRLENNDGVYLTEEQHQKGIQKSLEKYGVEHYQNSKEFKEKYEATSLKNHGVTHPSKSKDVIQKMVDTRRQNNNGSYCSKEEIQKRENSCQKKYGVKNVLCAGSEARAQSQQTKLEKYGDENYNNREGAAETCKERYGSECLFDAFREENIKKKMTSNYEKLCQNKFVVPLFSLDDYLSKDKDTIFKWKCLECGSEFESKIDWNNRFCCDDETAVLARCLKCHPMNSGTSKEEQDFIAEIRKIYSGPVEERCDILQCGDTKRSWLQIDCYLPNLKVGFEYDGIYYHQLSSDEDDSCKNLLKTEIAEKQGIKLVHVRSDQWNDNRETLLSLYRDIIKDKVDFSLIYDMTSDIVEVDRSIFNRCFSIPGYELVGEISPQKITIATSSRNYIYRECGKLVYRRKKDEPCDVISDAK